MVSKIRVKRILTPIDDRSIIVLPEGGMRDYGKAGHQIKNH
jgi:hypothetical protein